jgi:hypothetical protein
VLAKQNIVNEKNGILPETKTQLSLLTSEDLASNNHLLRREVDVGNNALIDNTSIVLSENMSLMRNKLLRMDVWVQTAPIQIANPCNIRYVSNLYSHKITPSSIKPQYT